MTSDKVVEAARRICDAIDGAAIPHANGGREVLNAWDNLRRATITYDDGKPAPKAKRARRK